MNHLISVCSVIALTLSLASCSPQPEYVELNGLTQGTTYHIVVEKTPGLDIKALRQDIEQLFTQVDNSLSIYNDSSLISDINANRSDRTDTLFREVFRVAAEVSSESGGVFGITGGAVSFTQLTLPASGLVEETGGARLFKKKKNSDVLRGRHICGNTGKSLRADTGMKGTERETGAQR